MSPRTATAPARAAAWVRCVCRCGQLPGEWRLRRWWQPRGWLVKHGPSLCLARRVPSSLAVSRRPVRHRPGSHVRDPSHIARPSPHIALYAASRHSYRPRTIRSTVIGPTTMPPLSSPPHARFLRSTSPRSVAAPVAAASSAASPPRRTPAHHPPPSSTARPPCGRFRSVRSSLSSPARPSALTAQHALHT